MSQTSQIKPVPMHVSLLLVNNFLINTTNFINQFSETVEKKISGISTKVTELEILLAVLEAKLNSIPGLEFSSSDLPATAPNPAAVSSAPGQAAPAAAVPPSATPAAATAAAPAVIKPAGVAAKDHPDYAAFFKMLRVGVPLPVVAGKMSAAGFNSAILDNPEAMVEENSNTASGDAGRVVVHSSSQALTAPPPPPPPAPPAPALPPSAETKEEPAPAPAAAPVADENPQYDVYRRMKRMLPEGPVRQKMSNDGCSQEEIDRFFNS